MNVKLLNLRGSPSGIYSNVNEVIQQLYLAARDGYEFRIKWDKSAYKVAYRPEDPWNYYFEDCYGNTELDEEALELLPGGRNVACAKDNIITPRLKDGQCNPLLLPKNRSLPHKYISKHIKFKSHIIDKVNKFSTDHFHNRIIALHIRGPGRLHGGAAELRAFHRTENGIPFDVYFQHVDAELDIHPEAKIFIASDSEMVINFVKERYDDKVIVYPATRSSYGEMQHKGNPENEGLTFDNYKLGEDMLVETLLMASTDIFIHGNSNVANFILCWNTSLRHKYVYECSK